MSSVPCFGSRYIGRGGWVMKEVLKVNTRTLSLQAAETPSRRIRLVGVPNSPANDIAKDIAAFRV